LIRLILADTRKLPAATGEYLSSQDEFFPCLKDIVTVVHLSQTEKMQDLIIEVGGEEIDKHMLRAPKLRTLWNEYFVAPWNCWSLGLNLRVPLNISNNQPIESWHNHGIRRLLRKALRGSTATVLNYSLPRVIYQDSIARIHIESSVSAFHAHCVAPRHLPYRGGIVTYRV
jgi:hypothetical protein|tara:strand:- start:450 stop:962 length:513 start_codon:yes stop_codon:yes gene_type:complete